MKNSKLVLIIIILLTYSCKEISVEPKKEAMIKPSIFNAINFSSDFNRESKFFNPFLQRKANIVSYCGGYLSFEYTPVSMSDTIPIAVITSYQENGTVDATYNHDYAIELTSKYIYFFHLTNDYPIGLRYFGIAVTGHEDEPIYSELTNIYSVSTLSEKNILTILAFNDDFTHGYISSSYKACGFFEFSEINSDVFGNDKTEYEYSYGRKMILSSENYIKKRLTFINLSMYQQNLLKILCNCENLYLNGTAYYLISDFTEKNKDEENEICDLQADFIEVEQSFFKTGADEVASRINHKNFFVH